MQKMKKTVTTQKRLRTLAPRALVVVERHKARHPGIAAVAVGVIPAATDFISVHDEAARFVAAKDRDMKVGRAGLDTLATHVVSGIALARSAEPNLTLPEVEVQVTAPERLISDAQKVRAVLVELGTAVPGSAAIIEAIDLAIEATSLDWHNAQEARVALQERQAQVRTAAVRLNRELVALRRILRAVLGTSDLAYQSLRVSRTVTETENETTELEETAEVDSAAAVTPTHTVRNGAMNGAPFSNREVTA
jgi:hypothetical protein